MLEDVIIISKKLFDDAFSCNNDATRAIDIYAIHKKLAKLLVNAKLVANHYLALDLTESFLQNSSFGNPTDKWRYFLNEDLQKLNKSVKKYLLKLYSLRRDEIGENRYLEQYYNAKSYYGVVTSRYCIGFVKPCGSTMTYCAIDTGFDPKNRYLEKYNQIDLSTFDAKKQLQQNILDNCKTLEEIFTDLQTYILNCINIEDLVLERRIW